MSMKVNPPVLSDDKSYERYKQELLAWREITNLDKGKQGIAVALSLPEQEKLRIRERVFDELTTEQLKADDGLTVLITFLDKHLGKDELVDSLEKYEDFEDFKRRDSQPIPEYISDFDSKYAKIVKKNMTLLPEILAFKLLKCANITKEERMLVLTGMNYELKNTLYEQAKVSLKKFKGANTANGIGKESSENSSDFKLEPTFLAENEEVLAAAGYYRFNQNRGNSNQYRRGFSNSSFRPNRGRSSGGNLRGTGSRGYDRSEKHMNPKSFNGKTLTCHACGSYRHLLKDCPHSYENGNTGNGNSKDTFVSDNEVLLTVNDFEHVIMYTGYDKREVSRLGKESQHSAVIDTACSSTVSGKHWYETFLSTFPENRQSEIKEFKGTKWFKFGGGECLQSIKCVHIPCIIAGHQFVLEMDVVDSNIPLLLSLKTLKNANVKLDLENDEAEIFGKRCALDFTSSGHYCIPITSDTPIEEVFSVNLQLLSSSDRFKALEKLHRQFAHPSKVRLEGLLTDAGVWDKLYSADLDRLYKECQTCKLFAKTPARPVVSMPMARNFNERVAMDLKILKGGKYILHMVDMFSRLTVSVFVKSKQPKEIVDAVLKNWIAVWGLMQGVLFDNGGEFSNHLMREVASILGVEICTTAAESPWSNGVCERNHHVTDRMLEILTDDNPDTDSSTLLAWANMAKNSLQMWNGFSSYQIVLGKNPNLPNILSGKIPYIQGSTSSDVLLQHLNALHSSRKAFMQSECDEKIRRALRHQIRAVEEHFQPGEPVFYKREGHNKWLGPAKVIFQDGRLVFVRHGGVYVRVSTNRIIKDFPKTSFNSDGGRNVVTSHNNTNHSSQESSPSIFSEVIGEHPAKPSATVNAPESVHEDRVNAPESVHEDRVNAPESVHEDRELRDIVDIRLKKNDKIQFRVSDNDEWNTATVLSKAGKSTGAFRHWYNVQLDNDQTQSLDFECIQWKHFEEESFAVFMPTCQYGHPDCVQAKLDELEKLKLFDTYDIVDDIGQDKISTRWVVTKKGDKVKARLVARGFQEEQYVQSDSPTVGKSTMRTFLAISASQSWSVKTTDIKSAFLQGKKLDRDVFLSPPIEAGVAMGKLWKLNHCLYGLNDAARQFYQSVKEELIKLGCKQSTCDPALFYLKDSNDCLLGLLVCHIDDFLHAGVSKFDVSVMILLRKRFLAGKLEDTSFTYIGFNLVQSPDAITLDQSSYMEELETVKLSSDRGKSSKLSENELTLLRRQVGKLNWAVQGSRPDLAFEMIELSTKLKNGEINDLKRANKAILKLKEINASIKFPCLGNFQNWRLMVFSDASLGNICNGVGSVGAHLILLVSPNNRCSPLNWQSNKIKRVVRSTIAAEALSLQEALEDASYLKHLIEEIFSSKKSLKLPVEAYILTVIPYFVYLDMPIGACAMLCFFTVWRHGQG